MKYACAYLPVGKLIGINHLLKVISQNRIWSDLGDSFKAGVEVENQAYSKLSLSIIIHLNYQIKKSIVYRIGKIFLPVLNSQVFLQYWTDCCFFWWSSKAVGMCLGSMLYKKRKSNFNHQSETQLGTSSHYERHASENWDNTRLENPSSCYSFPRVRSLAWGRWDSAIELDFTILTLVMSHSFSLDCCLDFLCLYLFLIRHNWICVC